jgi:hypothetical protein
VTSAASSVAASAGGALADDRAADEAEGSRRRLYAFLDELKRGDLQLGPADYARIDRVLLLLAARGIRPDHPDAANWLAPVLCGTPAEQASFHRRFGELAAGEGAVAAPSPAPITPQEREIQQEPRRNALRRWLFSAAIALFLAFAGAVVVSYMTPPPQTIDDGITPNPKPLPPPDFSTPIGDRLLALVPIGLLGLHLLWRRSRRLMLLRSLAPTAARTQRVSFAAANVPYYANPELKRALAAFRRHWATPGGSLHVGRTIRATMRAGGRPELRFGMRPRTPEYVLLVDCETARDHLAAAATLLQNQFDQERVIVQRYDYYGDPRRLVAAGPRGHGASQLRLLDAAAQHAGQTVLVFAEAASFFDQHGRVHGWVGILREWGRTVILTPRPLEYWDKAEKEIEREDILVIPALSTGLETLAERLKLTVAPDATLQRSPVRSEFGDRFPANDLAANLVRHRKMLLDEEAPADATIAELLIDLRGDLGDAGYSLLQALAVFPRVEPALTLFLGSNLRHKNKPLLDEQSLLAISRLPWLRVGAMPEWLRKALVHRLSKDRLEEILDLLQTFLQPVEDTRSGALSYDIGRRRGAGFRRLLLDWIRKNPEEFDDRILVDALNGRDPSTLGVPIPQSLAQRLRGLFGETEAIAIALALVASGTLALVHVSLVGWLTAALQKVAPSLARLIETLGIDRDSAFAYAYFALLFAIALWLVQLYFRRQSWPISPLWLAFASCALSLTVPSDATAVLIFATGVFVALYVAARSWPAAETLPLVSFGTFLGPAAIDWFFVAVWMAAATFAAYDINFHDWVLDYPRLVGLELVSILWSTLYCLAKTRFEATAAQAPVAQAARTALLFGLGQSLLPLLLVLFPFAAPERFRIAAGHTEFVTLAFVITSFCSGWLFVSAVQARWLVQITTKWRVGILELLLALFGTYIAALGGLAYWGSNQGGLGDVISGLVFAPVVTLITLVIARPIPLRFFQLEHSVEIQLSAVGIHSLELPSSAQLSRVAIQATIAGVLWSGLAWFDASWVQLRFGTLPLSSRTHVAASVFIFALVFYFIALRWDRPNLLQARTFRDLVGDAKLLLSSAMPWILIPVLWLESSMITLPGGSLPGRDSVWINLELILPAAVWLGLKYPSRVTSVLLCSAALSLLLSAIDPITIFGLRIFAIGSLGTLIAAVTLGQIVADRGLFARIYRANSLALFQLLAILLLIGTNFQFRSSQLPSFDWSNVIFLLLFCVGLSAIPLSRVIILLIVLAFAGPPLFYELLPQSPSYQAFVAVRSFFSHPSPALSAIFVMCFGRLIRPLLGLEDAKQFGVEPEAWKLFIPSALATAFVWMATLGFGYRTITWFGFANNAAFACLIFWAGLRWGRASAVLAVLTATISAVILYLVFPDQPSAMADTVSIPSRDFPIRLAFKPRVFGSLGISAIPLLGWAVLGWRLRSALAARLTAGESQRDGTAGSAADDIVQAA